MTFSNEDLKLLKRSLTMYKLKKASMDKKEKAHTVALWHTLDSLISIDGKIE